MTLFHSQVVDTIRACSAEMDQTGIASKQILDVIVEQGLFKLFVPQDLGGLMTPMPEAFRIFEQGSWIDGTFGWLITIGSGGGFFTATMPPTTSKRLYMRDDAVVAGSGHPMGTAVKVDGGYNVNGQWRFCSGSTHATLFTANSWITDENATEPPVMRSFTFLPDQVNIIADWNAFGLRATSSYSIEVVDAFVPDEMTFDIMSEPYYDEPIFKYPFKQFAEGSFAAVSMGLGRHFLEEARSMVSRYQDKWSHTDRYAFVMKQIGQAEMNLSGAIADFYSSIEDSWNKHISGEPLTEEHLEEVSRKCKKVVRVAVQGAELIYPYLGIHAVMQDTLINRIWRDLHTASQHAMLIEYE
ncbi:acyl-CoA dehydrogenase [Paenibacillus sp. N1-5-1-14]|uniref:acyl-CoA dehydrogenase n=1 Tax=Paenibacillus radicibacter TaxID=2972488 RepID=UPI0021591842|nr:acyl-CoA dehydrogenase [Paenibacillus radicibacter]MCR8644983.1 acyl-CoA dehydrogenase [Paenibacillus radicibacter]